MFAPTTFGKYFLYEKLAIGGMAEIYKGKLHGPGGFEKILVIKQILPELARRREFIELFVQEAKTTVALTHGNIVPIYELGVIDGTYYTAMEYIDGPTLHELLSAVNAQGKLLPVDVTVALVIEVLKGLEYAHRKANASGGLGIVHRDLSPRNVMISREGEVKILDFGIATAAESGAGELMGSYAYMSPEQAARERLDPRSDLFSCGILLWEMLTGDKLFVRDDADSTLAAVRKADVRAPSQLRGEIPAEIDDVCTRALAQRKDDRSRSAQELLRPLMRWLYARAEPPGAKTLASWVGEYCPTASTQASAPATQVTLPPATKPMQRKGEVVTFATRVNLAELPPSDTAKSDAGAATAAATDATAGTDADTAADSDSATDADATAGTAADTAADAVSRRAAEPVRTKVSPGRRTAPRRDLGPTPAMGVAAARAAASAEPASAEGTERIERAAPPTAGGARWAVGAVLVAAIAVVAFFLLRGRTGARPAEVPPPVADAEVLALRPDARALVTATPDAGSALAPDAAVKLASRRDAGLKVAIKRDAELTAAETGTLSVGANPFATITVDGVSRGKTPAPALTLPAGKHTVELNCPAASCPPSGLSFRFSVEIVAGQTVRRAVDFTGPEPALIE